MCVYLYIYIYIDMDYKGTTNSLMIPRSQRRPARVIAMLHPSEMWRQRSPRGLRIRNDAGLGILGFVGFGVYRV